MFFAHDLMGMLLEATVSLHTLLSIEFLAQHQKTNKLGEDGMESDCALATGFSLIGVQLAALIEC